MGVILVQLLDQTLNYLVLVGPTRALQVSPRPAQPRPAPDFIFSSLLPPYFWQPCYPLNLATLPPEA